MRIEKKTLNDALRVLGKVVCQMSPVELYQMIRFMGNANGVEAMATDGIETVTVKLDATSETEIDFCVAYRDLKDLVRICRNEELDLTGKVMEYPVMEEVALDAVTTELPKDFTELLALAAPIINRNEFRRVLHGVNLSADGVTVTDGKQLLHLPCPLELAKDVTLPFPSALLAAKLENSGTLKLWNNLFLMEIGNVSWYGKLLEGQYPNWKTVIPTEENLDYCITLLEPEKVLNWVKMIPSQKSTNGVELAVMSDETVTLISSIQPEFKLNTTVTMSGPMSKIALILDREILLRMLLQGYTTFKAHSEKFSPVVAAGGVGQYIAMPIRTIPKIQTANSIEPNKEEKKMEIANPVVEQSIAPVVNPLDELGTAIEDFKLKIKAMFDESTALSRKVKEISILQKQKERDFIQAKRAIERIRMAI